MENNRLVKIINELRQVKKGLAITYSRSGGWYSTTTYLSDRNSIENTIKILQDLCRQNNRKKYNVGGDK